MVKVAATVELDRVCELDIPTDVVFFHRFGCLNVQSVKVINVGPVMFAIVELHLVAGDNGL